jgi:hypothetical protein
VTRRWKRIRWNRSCTSRPMPTRCSKRARTMWPYCRHWKPGNRRSSAGEPVRRHESAFRVTKASCPRRRTEVERATASVGAAAAACPRQAPLWNRRCPPTWPMGCRPWRPWIQPPTGATVEDYAPLLVVRINLAKIRSVCSAWRRALSPDISDAAECNLTKQAGRTVPRSTDRNSFRKLRIQTKTSRAAK